MGGGGAGALRRGRLTLIDLDVVAESNLNRQAHATLANLGRNKVDAMQGARRQFCAGLRGDTRR